MKIKSKFSVSVFEDQRPERTDFAVIHDSSSIRAGPSVGPFFLNLNMVNRQAGFVPESYHQASHMVAAQ